MWFIIVTLGVLRAVYCFFRQHRSSKEGVSGLLKLTVAKTYQEVHSGSVFQCLRIPDTGGRGHKVFDAFLLTERELFVFSVPEISGVLRLSQDGSWIEKDTNGNEKIHPNGVTELHDKLDVLAEYVARRGVTLPREFLKPRVVFVDEFARPEQQILLQPEVISYDRWEDIRQQASNSSVFGFRVYNPSKSRIYSLNPLYQQLKFILSTAPTWDRLELRGGGILFGEFVRFKGSSDDMAALNVAKRTKISHYEAFHKWSFWSFLGLHSTNDVRVVCSFRDHRQQSSINPNKVELNVREDVEILFQVDGTSKPRAFLLRDINVLAFRV